MLKVIDYLGEFLLEWLINFDDEKFLSFFSFKKRAK